MKVTRRRFLAAAGLVLAAYMVPGSIRAYNVEVSSHRMGLGIRVLQVADLHLHGKDRISHLDLIEAVKPDILVLGGDTWDLATRSIGSLEDWITSAASASRRLVAVLGNHEYTADRRGRIGLGEGLRILERHGVIVLRDEIARVSGLRIAGLDWRWEPEDYSKAVAGLDGLVEADLVVAHSPDVLPHLGPGRGLVLTGHTHGGQVCLPGGRGMATNSVYGYRSGLYQRGGWVMIVSRGAGELVPPRVYCRRELVLVT